MQKILIGIVGAAAIAVAASTALGSHRPSLDRATALPGAAPHRVPPYRFMFNSSSAQKQVASYGFNLLDVGSKWAADQLPKSARGLVWVGDYDNSSCSWEMSDASLRTEVRSAVGDRRVAGYFFSDEPDPFACPAAPAEHAARSKLIHSIDPKKFTVLDMDSNSGRDSLRQITRWRGAADYIALDPYPCHQGSRCNYAWITAIIKAANRAHIRYWGVAEAFADSDWRWPTPAEERHMLAQWGASKESGFMTFAWTWAGNNLSSQPGLLRALKDFNRGRIGSRLSMSPAARRDPVVAAAGDICGSPTDCAPTAALIGRVNPTRLLPLGDNAYPDGTSSDYADFYAPNWGRFKSRTRPVPGNHDYHVSGAAGYFAYFGSRAPAPYYSYNLGAWHLIALDSEVSADKGSPQDRWLRADLAANRRRCTLAYWHKPRWSSGTTHGSDSDFDQFWRDLYAAHADVVLNGHEHNYERFALQNPRGIANPKGIREFVVGTGGDSHYSFGAPLPTSQVRNDKTYGVLKLTLRRRGYAWRFIPVAGATFSDSGSAACH